MTEMILDASEFPEPILSGIKTRKVRVRSFDGEFRLTPVVDRDAIAIEMEFWKNFDEMVSECDEKLSIEDFSRTTSVRS